METELKALAEAIEAHEHIVFFSGEGVSAECGVPVLAEHDQEYEAKYGMKHRVLLSAPYLRNHPQEFYSFFRTELRPMLDTVPNCVHEKLAALEAAGKLTGIVTTNRDRLHQRAGSKRVVELNGAVAESVCPACGKKGSPNILFDGAGLPCCECGAVLRPDFSLTGEGSNQKAIQAAIELISEADMLIVAGTRLTEYPEPEVVTYFKGKPIVAINKEHVPFEQHADIILSCSCQEVFAALPF